MDERFSNRQSLMDAATVLAARRAIDRELAHLIADPFDRDAAKRLHDAVGANADRAQEALERLVHVTELREPWEPGAVGTGSGAGSDGEVAPPSSSPHRYDTTHEEPAP
ncbi:hypothetical protein [Jiangella muralis]|uniref:hypothetical protein n=1 Tax=Jiangella muralis TaxID=702383 RepID=UPI00069E3762|nr:hypothetical protein [Jiangella muralis]